MAGVVILLLAPAGRGEDVYWTNASGGNWTVAGNWSAGRVPGVDDRAFITLAGTYTVTLAAAAQVAGLTVGGDSGTQMLQFTSPAFDISGPMVVGDRGVFAMNGGALHSASEVALHGSATWTAGLMTGAGRTVIADGATLTISSGLGKAMDAGRVLENRGSIVWTGGNINLNNGGAGGSGRIENTSTGEFEIALLGGSMAASGFADINSPPLPGFDNAGTLRKSGAPSETTIAVPFVNTGLVKIESGTLRLTGGGRNAATLDVGADATVAPQTLDFAEGSQLVGAGLYLFDTGTQSILADLSIPRFSKTGGTLAGTAALTITGSADWSAGLMTETGRTVVAVGGTLTISGGLGKAMDAGRVLENRGSIVWAGGNINLNNGGTGGSGRIENASTGVFEITLLGGAMAASGFADINSPPLPGFDNAGTLRKSGAPSETTIAIPFSNIGTVAVESGTLRLTGGGRNAGSIDVAADATMAPQTLEFTEGSLLSGAGLYLFDTGTQSILADQSIPHFSKTGGTLAGTAALTITGSATWSAGLMTETGRTVVAEGATLTISDGLGKSMDAGRVLENRGSIVWTGGAINLNNGGTGGSGRIENASTGVFEITHAGGSITASGFADINSPPLPAFDNAGTLRKSGDGAATTVSVPFSNSGTVEMFGGSLNVSSSVTLLAESRLRFVISGTSPGEEFGRFAATGAIELKGAIDLALGNGFEPAEGDRYNLLSASALTGSFDEVRGNVLPNLLFFSPDQQLRDLIMLSRNGNPSLETDTRIEGSTFRVRGISGQLYRIYANPDLGLGRWGLIHTFVMPGSGFNDFTDPDSANFPQRFYYAEFLPANP